MQNLRVRKPRSKRFIDHTGERIGTLTALSFAGFQGRFPKWRCRCDCGQIRTIFNRDFNRPRAYKVCRCVPATRDPYLYNLWIKRVCPDCCLEWKSFVVFRESIGKKPKGKFLSKRRLSEPWSPENFEWVGRGRKLAAKLFEFNGKKQTAREWCEELQISRQRFHQRLNSGLPKEHIFAPRGGPPTPIRGKPNASLFAWASVADGKRHRLVRGKDFDCDPDRLERSLDYWAKQNRATTTFEKRRQDVVVCIQTGRGRTKTS
jgi:hypothetical protein